MPVTNWKIVWWLPSIAAHSTCKVKWIYKGDICIQDYCANQCLGEAISMIPNIIVNSIHFNVLWIGLVEELIISYMIIKWSKICSMSHFFKGMSLGFWLGLELNVRFLPGFKLGKRFEYEHGCGEILKLVAMVTSYSLFYMNQWTHPWIPHHLCSDPFSVGTWERNKESINKRSYTHMYIYI